MSDNEAREETPPEYEEDVPTDWDIYVNIIGVIFKSRCDNDGRWYECIIFVRIYKVNTDPNFNRDKEICEVVNPPNDGNTCDLSINEWRKLKKMPCPIAGGSPMEENCWDVDNGYSAYDDLVTITSHKSTIYTNGQPRTSE